jgi:hypothetical protein
LEPPKASAAARLRRTHSTFLSGAFNFRTMPARPRTEEYFVVTVARGRPPVWTWEIRRRPTPLGIILSGAEFRTETDAKLAGEKALVEFLVRLGAEEQGASGEKPAETTLPVCEKCGRATELHRLVPGRGILADLFSFGAGTAVT